jgi:hypothetical protein
MAGFRQLLLPWDRQPQEPTGVNAASKFARGLAFAINGATRRDELTGRPLTPFNGATQAVAGSGLGLRTDGTDDYLSLSLQTTNFSPGTIIWVGTGNSPAVDRRAFSLGNTGNADRFFAIGTGVSAANKLRVFARGDGNVDPSNTTLVTSADVFHGAPTVAALVYETPNITSYVNGAIDTGTALAGIG